MSHHIVISSHTLDQEMNRRAQITVLICICVVVMSACYWHATSHVHKRAEEKLPLFPKSQPQTADEEMMDEMMNETMDEDKDKNEEKEPSFPETLPYPIDLKKIDEIQKELWITHLYQFLRSLNKSISPQFNMVFGDSDHKETVLNWIIAALVRLDPPLHNIMVLSIDQPLCDFLASKMLPVTCIAVPPKSFLNQTVYSKLSPYGSGIRCRFVVLRIINFWGYDVASYDSDAVLLRNPQPLYDSNPDVKLFAGSDTYPNPISNQWGFSLCAGVLFLKSHPSTGMYTVHIHVHTYMHTVKSSDYTSHTFLPYICATL